MSGFTLIYSQHERSDTSVSHGLLRSGKAHVHLHRAKKARPRPGATGVTQHQREQFPMTRLIHSQRFNDSYTGTQY